MTIDVKNRIVIICGPVASGKTRLARKLLNEKSTLGDEKTNYISVDEIWEKINPKALKENRNYVFSKSLAKQVKNAVDSGNFTVIEGALTSNTTLSSIISMINILGEEVTLIKVYLDLNENIRNCSPQTRLKDLKKQRKLFFQVLTTDYKQTVQYVVTNLSKVKFSF